MKYRICRLRAFTCRPEIWSTTTCYGHAPFCYWSTIKIERNVFPTHALKTCLFVHCVKLSTKRKVSLSKLENDIMVNNFKCNIFYRILPHTRIWVVDVFCRRRKIKEVVDNYFANMWRPLIALQMYSRQRYFIYILDVLRNRKTILNTTVL